MKKNLSTTKPLYSEQIYSEQILPVPWPCVTGYRGSTVKLCTCIPVGPAVLHARKDPCCRHKQRNNT